LVISAAGRPGMGYEILAEGNALRGAAGAGLFG
jgi:hypothetical protein